MTKIVNAILILRKAGSSAWTTDLDNQMVAWTKQYITWLTTADIAVQESKATKFVTHMFLSPTDIDAMFSAIMDLSTIIS